MARIEWRRWVVFHAELNALGGAFARNLGNDGKTEVNT